MPGPKRPKCLIPQFDGAIFLQEWKQAFRDKFVTHRPDQIFIQGMKIPTMHHDHARRSRSLGIFPFAASSCRASALTESRVGAFLASGRPERFSATACRFRSQRAEHEPGRM